MTEPATETGAPDDLFGVLRAAGLDVALPLSALREVVPHPGRLEALPVRAAGLVGAMRLRRTVLPVLDLRLLHDAAPPVPEGGAAEEATGPIDSVVVVVAHDGRLVGLVVDEVRGVAKVPAEDQQALSASGARLLVSHVFQHGEDAAPVSVLDPAMVLGVPGVPTVAERREAGHPGAAESEQQRSSRDGRTALTVFRCGPHRLAIAIADLRTTIPLPVVGSSLLRGGHCLGVTTHDGRELPVLDPLSLLGLDPQDAAGVTAGIVVPVGTGEVVLAVSALDHLRLDPGGHLSVPGWAASRTDLLDGMVQVDDETCLVLCGDGLRADRELLSFAALNVDAVGAAATRDDDDAVATTDLGPTCLTYHLGGTLVATPLGQVVEILPRPESLTRTHAPDVEGLTVHRGHTVAVVDLAHLVDRVVDRAGGGHAGCLLLVEVGGEHVAFAVDGLETIKPRVWTDEGFEHHPPPRELRRTVQDSPLVRVAELDRLLPQVDLHQVARHLLDRTTCLGDVLAPDAA